MQTKFGASAQNNIGIMGHSRGGEGVVKVARLTQEQGLPHNINAVMSLAPTDQYGREAFGGAFAAPFFVLYGSRDGDVSGGPPSGAFTWRRSGFSLYDRATGADKSMLFLYKATHNGFITSNSDNGEAGVLAPATQKTVTQAYTTAFFRQHLRNEPKWDGMFTGEWTPASVSATGAECFMQCRKPGGKVVDDFQSAVPDWTVSTIGGAVSQAGLPVNPAEGRLVDFPVTAPGLDPQSPHDTGGLKLQWNNGGDRLTYMIPVADQDVSGFSVLSLRITQKEASPINPANQPQDLRVVLKDAANNQRAIRAGAFGAIPFPDQRATLDRRKSALTSIRIPLTSYTIVCAGQPKVNLSSVVELALQFDLKPAGEIEIDEIEFTN